MNLPRETGRRSEDRGAPASIAFHRTKYGAELLVDVAWIRDIPTFLLDRPHQLRFYDLTLVTRGRGRFWLDDCEYAVEPGVILCTSPGQVRRWTVEALDGLCLFFPAEFLESFFSDPLFLYRLAYFDAAPGAAAVVTAGRERRRLARVLAEMHDELRRLREDSSHALRARLYEVLVSVSRWHEAQHGGVAREPDRVTVRYRTLVAAEARREHRVAPYARKLAVSPNHLNALCRRHLGITAKQVIDERLGTEARRLLRHSDASIAEIAFALGFCDPSHFTRFFRRHAGCGPRELRQG